MSVSLPKIDRCRLTNEPLDSLDILFELDDCPLPGIYAPSASESETMSGTFTVVRSRTTGFVQMLQTYDPSVYLDYGFAAGAVTGFSRHLEWAASLIAERFPQNSNVLEVGCGDGAILDLLKQHGFEHVNGIDPSLASLQQDRPWVHKGFFPQDLPSGLLSQPFDLILSRHVLEHIETPVAFLAAAAERLSDNGELWIEVPDLRSTVKHSLWTNFYQLHCNYFSARTLDEAARLAGLERISASTVDVFGGSLFHRYQRGLSDRTKTGSEFATLSTSFDQYSLGLNDLVERLPLGTIGYGVGDRTTTFLGIAPSLRTVLRGIYDQNPNIVGRFLSGTRLRIEHTSLISDCKPPCIVVFPILHLPAILSSLASIVPPETLVAVPDKTLEITSLGNHLRRLQL